MSKVYDKALVDDMVRNLSLPMPLAKQGAEGIVAIIQEGLARDGVVNLTHLGTFRLKPVAERAGFNPRTRERITIPAHHRVVFSPAKALRDQVEPPRPPSVPIVAEGADAVSLLEIRPTVSAAEDSRESSPQPATVADVVGIAGLASSIDSDRFQASNEETAVPSTGSVLPDPSARADADIPSVYEHQAAAESAGESGEETAVQSVGSMVPDLSIGPDAEIRSEYEHQAATESAELHGQPVAVSSQEPAVSPEAPPEPVMLSREEDSANEDRDAAPVAVARHSRDDESRKGSDDIAIPHPARPVGRVAPAPLQQQRAVAATMSIYRESTARASSGEPGTRSAAVRNYSLGIAATVLLGVYVASQLRATRPEASNVAVTRSDAAALQDSPVERGDIGAEAIATSVDTSENTPGLTSTIPATHFYFKEQTFEVARGENLWRLAEKHYQNAYLWPHIYQANVTTIQNPDYLVDGETLVVPGLEGSPDQLTDTDRQNIARGYYLTYLFYQKVGRSDAALALRVAQRYDVDVAAKYR